MTAGKQTRYALRRGLHKTPIQYKILSVNMLKAEDKKLVAKTVIKLLSPKDAKALTGKRSKWSYTAFGYPLEGGVLKYKGAEVALFYSRTTETFVPEPCDPAPEGWLENPADVWVRFDLTGLSSRQLSGQVRTDLLEVERENSLLSAEVKSLEAVVKAKEHTEKVLQGRIKELEKQISKKEKKNNGKERKSSKGR